MTLCANLKVLEISRHKHISIWKHLCTLSSEVVKAEVSRCVHAIVTIVCAAQLKLNLLHLAEAAQVNITPIVDDVCLLSIAQVSQIELFGACHLFINVITRDGQQEPVTLPEFLGKAIAASQGIVSIRRVGDIEAWYHSTAIDINSSIARTVEVCYISHAVVA